MPLPSRDRPTQPFPLHTSKAPHLAGHHHTPPQSWAPRAVAVAHRPPCCWCPAPSGAPSARPSPPSDLAEAGAPVADDPTSRPSSPLVCVRSVPSSDGNGALGGPPEDAMGISGCGANPDAVPGAMPGNNGDTPGGSDTPATPDSGGAPAAHTAPLPRPASSAPSGAAGGDTPQGNSDGPALPMPPSISPASSPGRARPASTACSTRRSASRSTGRPYGSRLYES